MPDPYILLPDGSRATLDHDADCSGDPPSYHDETTIHGTGHCVCGADADELRWIRFGYCGEQEAVECPQCDARYEVHHAAH